MALDMLRQEMNEALVARSAAAKRSLLSRQDKPVLSQWKR